MTVLTLGLSILRQMLPDETVTPDLEELLTKVLHNTHYLPAGWKGQAHRAETRKKFQQIFQYSFAGVIESVVSPLLTSYILWKHVYPRSIEYVDFFRNFTINVAGVGDVCSFAQMDLRQHGNPEWHQEEMPIPDQYSQCEDGKVEMSLVHFKSTNPDWVPPESMQEFVKTCKIEVCQLLLLACKIHLRLDMSQFCKPLSLYKHQPYPHWLQWMLHLIHSMYGETMSVFNLRPYRM